MHSGSQHAQSIAVDERKISCGARVALAVGTLLWQALQVPPTSSPCAAIILFDCPSQVLEPLQPAPRAAIHNDLLSSFHCADDTATTSQGSALLPILPLNLC
jgi:hypothetical protein